MSGKHPPRYVERFEISFNDGCKRVTRTMELQIDLATIRRMMGLRAAKSICRKSQDGNVKVICVTPAEPCGEATSNMMEVAIG